MVSDFRVLMINLPIYNNTKFLDKNETYFYDLNQVRVKTNHFVDWIIYLFLNSWGYENLNYE
jgi:hypothetical protein